MYVLVLWYVHYIRARSREPLQVAPEHRAPQNQNRTFYNTRGKMDLEKERKKKRRKKKEEDQTKEHADTDAGERNANNIKQASSAHGVKPRGCVGGSYQGGRL